MNAPFVQRPHDPIETPVFAFSHMSGGMYGLVGIHLQRVFEDAVRKAGFDGDINERIALQAGISSGTIQALGRVMPGANGYTAHADELLKQYIAQGREIFVPRKGLAKLAAGRIISKYPAHNLLASLTRAFGAETTLANGLYPALVLGMNQDIQQPAVFRNYALNDMDLSVVDVAMASTAVPAIFPVHKMADGRHMRDGVFITSDPSQYALAALRHDFGYHSSQINLISFGVGLDPPLEMQDLPIGMVLQLVHGVPVLFEYARRISTVAARQFCAQELGGGYIVLDAQKPKEIRRFGIDDCSTEALSAHERMADVIVDAHRERIMALADHFARHARPVELVVPAVSEIELYQGQIDTSQDALRTDWAALVTRWGLERLIPRALKGRRVATP